METAIAQRIDAIAASYQARLMAAVSNHWASRATALYAVSLYYETQIQNVRSLTASSTLGLDKALLYAFRTIFAVYAASQPPETLDFSARDLQSAHKVLVLASEARLFQDCRYMLTMGHIEARLDPDGLAFVDPIGMTNGPIIQWMDELSEADQAAGEFPLQAFSAKLVVFLQISCVRTARNSVATI